MAVLRDGVVLAQHSWGWADIAQRIPFTAQTPFLICSITKQFTCSLLLDQFADPSVLDADLRALLPALGAGAPRVTDLAHNQSGLRDYWALTALCGADVEGRFALEDADGMIARTRSLQFAPGTRYSYCNQNFRLLSDLITQRTGLDFAEALRLRVFDRAGMPHARLSPDTSAVPDGTLGYEGSVEAGFRAAVNRIHWSGDVGIAASLEDLIAWERFTDATRDDQDGFFAKRSAPQRFRDGAPAFYGYGLARAMLLDHAITCHGGGLRGWRSFRMYAPGPRISVVVLFNHMADPRAAAAELFAAILDQPAPPAPKLLPQGLAGRYIEPETGLAVRLDPAGTGQMRLHFTTGADLLTATDASSLAGGGVRVESRDDGVWMHRAVDNLHTRLVPVGGAAVPDMVGRFACAELGSVFTCADAGGVLYGAFSGHLGEGEMQPLQPYAQDIWLMPCPRALDYAAPGDWTVTVRRDNRGHVAGLTIGNWLARGLAYQRV